VTTTADRFLPIFSSAFAAGILAPVFAHGFFPLYPTLPWSQLIDFFTPVVLIPLYWLLFAGASAAPPSRNEAVAFMVGVSVWALGHGMHLAANSIGYAMRKLPPSYAAELAHLYDEVLGHYFWHGGVVALSASITLRSVAQAHDEDRPGRAERGGAVRILAALLYGLTYFLLIIEGGTAPLGLPFAALFVIASLARWRATIARRPILSFFFVAHLFALVLFAVWAAMHQGLPQFSEVGIID
jgi:hypothetical protein